MPACQAGAGRITAGLRTRPRRLAVDLPVFKPAGRAGGRMDAPDTRSLPENAYQPLAPGETYAPIVPATTQVEEATVRSVGWGLFLCIVFTVASAYSGLKVGQVMEASIPISILAIGLARTFRRRSTLLENVILTNIGGTSGGMVAGAIFTLPALYILHLSPNPLQTSFILIAGGCLGVLFLIPLRRYFVRETHGGFPYPEAAEIFRNYVRFVGVGAIATAGIFGIIKSMRIVAGSFAIAARAFKHGEDAGQERTDRDMPIMTILIGVIVTAVVAGIFFNTLEGTMVAALIGLLLNLLFS